MNTRAGTGGAGPPERVIEKFRRLADRAVRRRNRGGHLIVRIESADGSLCWETTATGADEVATPIRPGTPFHLASLTKMYTAALVLRLAAHNRLALTDPITAHLPAELTDRLHVLDGHDRSVAITVERLLAHASGLPDYFTEAPRGRSSLAARLTGGVDEAWTVGDVADQVRRLRPHFVPQELDARHVRVRYSDTNYQLLGAIVEAATGAAFAATLRGELLEPLGLHHTWMAGTDGAAERPSPAPIRNRGGQLDLPLAFDSMGPDGGLISTAADAIGFLRALHADPDGRLATMTARWHRFSFPRDRSALLTPGWPIEYGLGIMRFRAPRVLNAGRRAAALIGHTGSTGSWAFHSPEDGLYLVGTFDNPRAAGAPYRVVPALVRAHSDESA